MGITPLTFSVLGLQGAHGEGDSAAIALSGKVGWGISPS